MEHVSYCSHLMFKSHIHKNTVHDILPRILTGLPTKTRPPKKAVAQDFLWVKLFPRNQSTCEEYQFDGFRFDGVTCCAPVQKMAIRICRFHGKLDRNQPSRQGNWCSRGLQSLKRSILHLIELPYFRRLKLGCKLQRDIFTTAMHAYCK